MNKKVKQLWLEALRSGEYLKGKNRLRTVNAFCCLGVLCDLHAKAFKQDWEIISYPGRRRYAYLNETYYLPKEVTEWAGLNNIAQINTPRIDPSFSERHLTNLNDRLDSFTEIADYIEANL